MRKISKNKGKILFVIDMRDSGDPNMKLLNSYRINDSEIQH